MRRERAYASGDVRATGIPPAGAGAGTRRGRGEPARRGSRRLPALPEWPSRAAAQFMDVTVPRVAATQFTACMAMLNFVISYSANWQGWAVTRWGYPVTLAADSAVGLVCLALLPLMKPVKKAIATLAPSAAVEPATG